MGTPVGSYDEFFSLNEGTEGTAIAESTEGAAPPATGMATPATEVAAPTTEIAAPPAAP
jgi:hypothetical protein